MTEKKNVLIFAATYLPGVKGGGPIKSIKNIVENLNNEYNFYIVTSDRDLGDSKPYKNIEVNKWIKNENSIVMYVSQDWYSMKNIKRIISEINWDCIYLNSFFGYKFSILPLIVSRNIIKDSQNIIIAPRGELDKGALELKKLKKKIYISISKLFKIYKNVVWHATCNEEKQYIKNVFKNSKYIHVASNLTERIDDINYLELKNKKEQGKIKIVFLSRISRKKNLKFAIQTLKNLNGNVILDIYGPIEDDLYWKECQGEINKLSDNIKVNYKGIVENSKVKLILSQYDLFYLPTYGENYGHVIIEALISACPVLISDMTPWINLERYKCGWDIPLSDENKYKEVLQKIIDSDKNSYEYLSKGAYEYGCSKLTNTKDLQNHSKLFKINRSKNTSLAVSE